MALAAVLRQPADRGRCARGGRGGVFAPTYQQRQHHLALLRAGGPSPRGRFHGLSMAQLRRTARQRPQGLDALLEHRHRLRKHPRRQGPAAVSRLPGEEADQSRPNLQVPARQAGALRSRPRRRRRAGADQEEARLAPLLRRHDRDAGARRRCSLMGDHVAAAVPVGPEPGWRPASKAATVTEERVGVLGPSAAESIETAQHEQSVYFDRWDVLAILGFTVVAFVIRFYSPIMPDFFLHPFQGPAITNCVSNTPINAPGDPGKLCGLAYPFNRGYADNNGVLSPPNGQVFDEIYFPVDAYDDVKGMELCRPSTTDCKYNYFDPEPPLAKLMIAGGEWGYGWYRATFQGAKGDFIDLGFNTFGWRIAVCIFGTLCVPLMYLFARRLWPNRLFALAAATLVCFDGMFFLQSRLGMIDIFPIFFILLGYTLYIVHIQSRTPAGSLVSLIVLGTILGVGIASKWIVLAAWATIVLLLVARVVRRYVDVHIGPAENPIWTWERGEGPAVAGGARADVYVLLALVALVAIPLAIYYASWYPFFLRGQFQNLADLIEYQRQSYIYHATLTATHPYGSPWWSWPFLSRPVLYYAEYTNLGIDHWTGQALTSRIADPGKSSIWCLSPPCVLA